jgi:hypothetical protein
MTTAKLHNLPATQASACAMQGCAYRGTTPHAVRPWLSNEEILVEGAAFGRGSNDPIQEALL